MKRILVLLTFTFYLLPTFGQSPNGMTYQAVVRNSSDQLVPNTTIGVQISILQGSASGTVVYSEIQTPTTNANGLISIEIGNGNGFDTINWANGPYFIKTEVDIAGGTNYTITGTSQLLSVPYALHAKTAESVTGTVNESDPVFNSSPAGTITSNDITYWNNKLDTEVDGSVTNELQTLYISNDTIYLTNGGFVKLPVAFSGNYNDLNGAPTQVSSFTNDAGYLTSEVDGSVTNELQTLSISNDTVYLTNGGFVKLPAGFSGDYNDLTNKPAIPANVSELNNDAGYLTSFTESQILSISNDTIYLTGGSFVKLPAGFDGQYSSLTGAPTNVSSFTNDAGYITGFTEIDPKVGSNTIGYSPKWDGSSLVTGAIYQDANGHVGIGTTSPGSAMLSVWNGNVSVSNGGVLANTGFWGDALRTNWGNDLLLKSSYAGKGILFNTQSGEKMRIDANGNVGIGTTSPGQLLDVQTGNINTSANIMTSGTARLDASGNLINIGNITATGASTYTSGAGTALSLQGGNSTSAIGGAVNITAGTSGTNISGADVNINGGPGGWNGSGGAIKLKAGTGGESGGDGAFITLNGGGPNYGTGGSLILSSGVESAGNYWDVGHNGAVIMAINGTEYMRVDGDRNGYQGNVGIGTATPGAKLEVNGQVKITGGTPGLNKVLTSDASGLATWSTLTPSGLGAWSTTGNSGTVDGTNFIGTTDNVALTFKVNNKFSGKIDPILDNTFLGYEAGTSNVVGKWNIGIGRRALYSMNSGTGNANIAIGQSSLEANLSGGGNTSIGHGAMTGNTSGAINTAVGYGALSGNLSGNNNTALGAYAGQNATGTANVFLGYQAGSNEAGSNKLYIANSNVNPPLIYGDFSTGRVGIGTTNTNAQLNVYGGLDASFNGPALGIQNNKVLTFWDASNGQWGSSIFTDNSNDLTIASRGYTAFFVSDDVTETMRLLTNGNVGIGTTSPTEKLEVNGNVKVSGSIYAPGTVVQTVVQTSDVTSSLNTTTYTEADPSYRISITSKFANSIILIEYSFSVNTYFANNTIFRMQLIRNIGGTEVPVGIGPVNGSRNQSTFTGRTQGYDSNDNQTIYMVAKDQGLSVGTTYTYGFKYQREQGGTGTCYFNYSMGDSDFYGFSGVMTMKITEIAQ